VLVWDGYIILNIKNSYSRIDNSEWLYAQLQVRDYFPIIAKEKMSMKEILEQFASYNIWANQKMSELVQSLPDDILQSTLPSSFTTIHATLLHMWDAESIWWQRMKLQEVIIFPSASFKGTTLDVSTSLLHQNKLWQSWVKNASIAALEHVFMYQNTIGEQFKQPIYQMILHVFNHGTYHRGQLVNMLRQSGIEKIPPTDFIVWSRKKGS
jgi:uncharacterized damage-inducible protein DinB